MGTGRSNRTIVIDPLTRIEGHGKVSTVVDDFPTLGVVVTWPNRFTKDTFQTAATPQVLAENGRESQRIKAVHLVLQKPKRTVSVACVQSESMVCLDT